MPDFEYTRDTDGDIILTKYTGNEGNVVIPREYTGCRVVGIGRSAFKGCSSLTSVTLPDNVTYIGGSAFSGCSRLISVIIHDSVTTIDLGAFSGCSRLISVIIHDSVTRIRGSAFEGCKKLTVYCPENSEAWKYCEEQQIPHKPLSEYNSEVQSILPIDEENTPHPSTKKEVRSQLPGRKSHARLIAAAILLALIAVAAGVQLSGLFDILGWLAELIG